MFLKHNYCHNVLVPESITRNGVLNSQYIFLSLGAQEDFKQFLTLQHRGMAHLLDTANKDLAALKIIDEGMSKLVA